MDSFWTNIAPLIVAVTALIVVLGQWLKGYLDGKRTERKDTESAKVAADKDEAAAKVTAAKVMEEIALAQLQDIKKELQELRDTLKKERTEAQANASATAREIAALTAEVQQLKRQLASETGDLTRQVQAQAVRILALETELDMVKRKPPPDAVK